MNTPISNPNKLAGAYQCCMCGKSVDQAPMLEFIANCGRNRKTRVWACIEHILGVEALECPAIADNMRSSDYHRMIDEKRREARSASVAASRFTDKGKADSRFNNRRDFEQVKDNFVPITDDAVATRKSDNGSFVLCSALTAKLGIPKESIKNMVEKMGITIMTHNGNPAIKNDDFLSLSNEVRRLAIANRRGGGSGNDGDGSDGKGIKNRDGSIGDSDGDSDEGSEDSDDR